MPTCFSDRRIQMKMEEKQSNEKHNFYRHYNESIGHTTNQHTHTQTDGQDTIFEGNSQNNNNDQAERESKKPN